MYAEALKLYEAAFQLSKTGELVVRAYQAQSRAGDRSGALARLERHVEVADLAIDVDDRASCRSPRTRRSLCGPR